MGKLSQALKFTLPALVASAAIASPAYADWNGRLVNGSFSTSQTVVTQFISPAIVGPQVEFTGAMRDGFGQNWTIGVDISGNFFTVAFNTPASSGGNISSDASLMVISLSGLTDASSLALLNYSCAAGTGFPCTTFNGGPNVASLSATNTTATVSFNVMRNGETYRFGVAAVPEPATWAMMIMGFGMVGFAMRRRHKVVVSYAA